MQTFNDDLTNAILGKLQKANDASAQTYPGESPERQPLHTVYGGAHLFKSDTVPKLGQLAQKSLAEYAPDFVTLAKALEFQNSEELPSSLAEVMTLTRHLETDPQKVHDTQPEAWLAYTVYKRVADKLKSEALEDFRIDFEDGFGSRADSEEDAAAESAAKEVAKGMKEKTLSPFIGIRIKPFTEELKARSVRTLDIFISTLVNETKGKLPDNFVVTLPKVTIPEQVTALVELFEVLEKNTDLKPGDLKMEIMVETTQSIIGANGELTLPSLIAAGKGRITGAHFGTYDYTASCSITAQYQSMDHPSCDFARHVMKVSLGSTGIFLSDGATNVMPVGPHRGENLSTNQILENRRAVHEAWKLGYDHVRHSLKHGFYQGWDLHPGQFPIRYAACYTFFLEGLDQATERLRNFMEKAAQATLASGNVFDDAATGQGLLNYFLRAFNWGAIGEEEILATGLTLDEIRGRSFAKIMETRRKASSKV